MKNFKSVAIALVSFLSFSWMGFNFSKINLSKDRKLSDVLIELNDSPKSHYRPNATKEQIERGKELVFNGRTVGPDGKMSPFISKYFACTSCHNQVQEDPNITQFDPQARLLHADKNNLKFLPATTFWGMYNRESWYNDDYVLKYGDLVIPANKSLEEATQLCAKVCSSGRYLENWELEAILAYYASIQLTIGDLNLTDEELNKLQSEGKKEDKIKLLKSKYALKSPATFPKNPTNKIEGYSGLVGDPTNGKKLYELSCQACHQAGGVSPILLDNAKVTFQKFKRNLDKNSYYNIYDIVVHGTYADKGKPRYMPLYPEERMSPQQIEDLRAYIEQEAK
ncbi:cytochrome c [bacterium]|nr:cytochrome c [bacterium]